jgi:hypothetical protein
MSKPKVKTAIEFLETCSSDEQEYIYEMYNDMAVSDLIDLLFEYMPSDDIEAELEDYRRENSEEYDDGETGFEDRD